jgi:hypothetical protein
VANVGDILAGPIIWQLLLVLDLPDFVWEKAKIGDNGDGHFDYIK